MASGRRPRINLRLVGERQINALLYPEANAIQSERPQTRGECVNGIRPCPWVGCRHHLYLNVNEETGSVTQNFPDVPVWDLKESCSLDVVDKHPDGLDMTELGGLLKLTKERIRQIQDAAEDELRRTAAIELGERDLPRPVAPVTRRPPHTPPRPAPLSAPAPLRRMGPQMALWILPPTVIVHRPRPPAPPVRVAGLQLMLTL